MVNIFFGLMETSWNHVAREFHKVSLLCCAVCVVLAWSAGVFSKETVTHREVIEHSHTCMKYIYLIYMSVR